MTRSIFSLNESLNYYLYPRYISMGKGVDCLCELIRQDMKANPLSGDVYLFFSKNKDIVKILRWDRDGFILYHKRLEAGTFELPRFQPDRGLYRFEWETFFMIMRGIPLRSGRWRKRFKM